MKKKIKLCLALVMAFAVLAQYSFSPQAMIAYGLDNEEGAAQAEETVANDKQEAEKQEAPAEEAAASETSGPSTEATEGAEPSAVSEESKQISDDEQKDADEQSVNYPAQKFSGMAGDVSVAVSAPEGALPEGAAMKVLAVKATRVQDSVEGLMGDSEIVKAVDVTFYNKEGKEVEPEKSISVTFTSKAFVGLKDASVVHIKDSGAAEIVENGSVTGNKASFKSNEFSIYVITDDSGDVTFRKTFHFEDINATGTYEPYEFTNKAGKEVTQQMAKTGDGLEPVGNPYHVGYDFDGWYVWDNGSWGDKVVFEDPAFVGTVSQDEDVTVRAKYGNVVYLNFHENPESASEDIILTTMAVPKDSAVAVNDVKAPLPGAGKVFRGWALKGTTEAVANPYTATANADLYPVFSGAHWLRFVGNGTGASYTEAICVYENQDLSDVTKPTDPTRQGYAFAGWYDAAEGGSLFEWSGKLQEDTFVYAHWTPQTNVQYSVFYWAENADDDNYSFVTSKKLSGTAGAQTNAQELTNQEKAAIRGVDWNGFDVQEITQGTIAGDGSTVVNVYYDRKMVTLIFHNNNGAPSYEEDPDGDYYRVSVSPAGRNYYYRTTQGWTGWNYGTINTNTYYHYNDEGPLAYSDGDTITLYERRGQGWGSTYYESTGTATITRYSIVSGQNAIVIHEKYGSDIHDKWPENPGNGTDWYLSPNGGTYLLTLTTMPATDTEYYYRPSSGRFIHRTTYMVQDVGGGNNFSEYISATSRGDGTATKTADDYNAITGFRVNAHDENDASNIRNTNGGDPNAVSNRQFNRSVEIGTSYREGRYDSSDNSYTLTFYYLRNQYDINFISNGNTVKTETGVYYEEDITGKVPSEYVIGKTEATIGGVPMIFEGWFDNADCEGYPYQFNKMPAGNLTLYAKWEPAWYVVNVDPNGGVLNGNSPTGGDSTCFWKEYGATISEYVTTRDYYEVGDEYAGEKYYYHFVQDINVPVEQRKAYYTTDASLSTDGKVYAKEEGAYLFLGWYAGDNEYDFESQITGPLTIKAKWRRTGAFHVAYQGIVDGIGSYVPSPEEGYADGAKITVSEAPKGINPAYVFDGWEVVDAEGKTLDDNEGAYYQPGDELTLDAKNADSSKIIHVQAHYTKVDDSTIPVKVVPLVFDANGGTISEAPDVTDKNNNTYSATINSGNTTATYSKLPMNQDYDLSTISPKVTRTDGYELLGWNTSKSAADNEEVLYKTNVIIGIDDLPDKANKLYAVWGRTYTVIWKSQDGTTTYETDTKVKKNSAPSYDGAVPTKAADAQYTYTFAGWATSANQESGKQVSELPKVTADATYYAAFSKTEKKFTVKWMNQDGSEPAIETDTGVAYNAAPSFDGTEPTKAADAQYTYTFAGWATSANQESGKQVSELPKVTADATYYAAFSKTEKTFTVKWMNQDGSEPAIETDTGVAYNAAPSFDGTEPTKAADAQYTYTFAGWATSANQESGKQVSELPKVTADATYYAAFSKTEKTFTVKWMNQDGEEPAIETDTGVAYNAAPSFDGMEPAKAADAQYTYTFEGWATSANQESGKQVSELPKVTADATYYAAFSKTVNKYTIKFVNDDGTELQSEDLEYGEMPEYKGETPTKDPSGGYFYEFAGWNPTIVEVTGEATYTATYNKIKNTAEITYKLNGGEYNGSTDDIVETHNIGEEITIHEAPTREGYTFIRWEGSSYQPGDKYTVEDDHTFTAIWEAAATDDTDDADESGDDESSETKTGDNTNLLGLLALMTAAALGLFGLVTFRRKEEE